MKKVLGVSAAVLGLLLMGANPAYATGISVSQPVPVDRSTEADVDRLDALSDVQTSAEVAEILESGEPVQALFDVDSNEFVAAYVEEPVFSTFAISVRGPGCAKTDACARDTANIPYGFSGTGSKTINISNVRTVSAGNVNTTWWYKANEGVNVTPNVSTALTKPVKMIKITRA